MPPVDQLDERLRAHLRDAGRRLPPAAASVADVQHRGRRRRRRRVAVTSMLSMASIAGAAVVAQRAAERRTPDIVTAASEIPVAEPASRLSIGDSRELPALDDPSTVEPSPVLGAADSLIEWEGQLVVLRQNVADVELPAELVESLPSEVVAALGDSPGYSDLSRLQLEQPSLAQFVPADALAAAAVPLAGPVELYLDSPVGTWQSLPDLPPPDLPVAFLEPYTTGDGRLLLAAQPGLQPDETSGLLAVTGDLSQWEALPYPLDGAEAGSFTHVAAVGSEVDGDRTILVFSEGIVFNAGIASASVTVGGDAIGDDALPTPTQLPEAGASIPARPQHRVVVLDEDGDPLLQSQLDDVFGIDVVTGVAVLDGGFVLAAQSFDATSGPMLVTSADGEDWDRAGVPIAGSAEPLGPIAPWIGTIDGADLVALTPNEDGSIIASVGSPFTKSWKSVRLPVNDDAGVYPGPIDINEHGVVAVLSFLPRTATPDSELAEPDLDVMSAFAATPQAIAWSPDGLRWSVISLDPNDIGPNVHLTDVALLDERIVLKVTDLSGMRTGSESLLTIEIDD